MRPREITPELNANLVAKVAAMTPEQVQARLYEIADAGDPEAQTPELLLEFAKLLMGPDGGVLWDDQEVERARRGENL